MGAVDNAVNLARCKSLRRQLPDFGRLVCPVRAEVTKHVLPGCKASAALRHSRSGGSNLGGEQTWGLEHNGMSAASKIFPRKVAFVDQSGKPTHHYLGQADDIGEVNRRVHSMEPPWQGTGQPRKDLQNSVEKVLLAAGADGNRQRHLERGLGRRRDEIAGSAHEPIKAKKEE